MVHIVLMRPGATDFDLQGRIQGDLDVPLSEQGRDEVKQAIEKIRPLGISTLYYSPNEAASETAQIIAEALQIKIKQVDNLRNLNQGLWQGMLVDEVRLKQPKVYRQWQEHPETVCPPDGEMLSEANDRIEETLERLIKKHKAGSLGLVAPEPLATLIAARLQGSDLGDLWTAHNDCRCCQEFDVNPSTWKIEVALAAQKSQSNGHAG